MNHHVRRLAAIVFGLAAVLAMGCASTTDDTAVTEAQRQLEERERELAASEAALRERDERIEALSQELETAKLPPVAAAPPKQSGPVLCATPEWREWVAQIQQALLDAGHSPGPIDGIVGELTLGAVKDYQEANALSTDEGLSYATVEALGVEIER